ncbi:hypothetical protein GCM10011369_33730 [Neiella marina]|uniref:Histidine kinase domain-containing protein n=1 Tax=Neiella marina TaxID=508461 RepID=A0A8J2XRF1_9GAMM|nr:transporter substrate-binding domain-containing protein [Neiella marina]GGA88840.1 hypothetical protein GCM10011369_33730 [Neiella marina]
MKPILNTPSGWQALLVGLLLLFSFRAWANPVLTPEEQQWLLEHPVVTVGNISSAPPFSYSENGQAKGFLPELVELIAEQAGFKVAWQTELTFEQLLSAGQAGQVDLLAGGVKTDLRSQHFYFSAPVIDRSLAAFTNLAPSHNLIDLTTNVAAMPAGSFLIDKLQQDYPALTVIPTQGVAQAFELVSQGKADFTIADEPTAAFIGRSLAIDNIRVAQTKQELSLYGRPIHLMAPKAHPQLKRIVDKAMNSLEPAKLKALRQKWLSVDDPLSLTVEERQWLNQAPVIRVQASAEYMPFDFLDDGRPSGYSQDLLALLAQKLGLKLEYVKGLEWHDYLAKMQNREIDLMASVYYSAERQAYLTYTDSYLQGGAHMLYGRSGSDRVQRIEDLKNKVVTVEAGSLPHTFLANNYPEIELRSVTSIRQGLESVLRQDSNYFLCDVIVCNAYIYHYFMSNLEVSGSLNIGALEGGLGLHFAVRSDWPILAAILQKAQDAITPQEEATLRESWIRQIGGPQAYLTDLTASEKQWLANNNRLIFSAAAKARPYSYLNRDNEFAGVSSDIVERLEDTLGIEAFYKPATSWAEALALLETGQIDFIPWIYITEPRTQHFLFSEPYFTDNLVLFTRSDFHYVSGLEDMTHRSLAVVRKSAIADKISADYPLIKLVSYHSIDDALQAVSSGQADGLVHSNAIMDQVLRLSDIDNIEFAATTPYRSEQAFAVHPSKPELVPLINKVIAAISEQERALLLDKWTHVRVVEKTDWRAVLLWLGIIILLAAAAVGAITIRNRRIAFQAVQKSEALLANAQRMAGMASWQWLATDDSMIWTAEGDQIINLPHNRQMTRRGYLKLIHPDDQLAVKQRWAQSIDQGVYQSEHRLIIDDKVKWIREIAELSTDAEGNLATAAGTTQDIHGQKMNELQLAEHAGVLQKLAAKLINVQEEERRRVAQELHDDFGQRLAAISIDAGSLELEPSISSARERVTLLKSKLIQVAADAHDLSRRLHPAMIDDLGLADALTTEIDSFTRRESIDVAFHVTKQLPELSAEVRLSLFRIVQEALDNVRKHSEASMVQVTIELENNGLLLQVIDDGMGFDVDQAMTSPGLGLQSMIERAKLIDAVLNVSSELNQGSTIELEVPCDT